MSGQPAASEQQNDSQKQPPVKYVIVDLDGTLLDTEALCLSVSKTVLAQFDVQLTPEICKAALGKRPLEAWEAVASCTGLGAKGVTGQQLYDMSEPLLAKRWGDAHLLPGAMRLLRHLAAHNIPYALATSTPRATLNCKLSTKPELRELLTHTVCGDEVEHGKPAPDTFLAAARLLGVPAGQEAACLVVEDAPSGVQGALAAGMQTVVIPSVLGSTADGGEDRSWESAAATGRVTCLPSLLAWSPEAWGLPAFDDIVCGVTPMDTPIRIKGEVVRGFGRGSKELGIPTANVDPAALVDCLSDAVTGIYAGWASIGASDEVHMMVMSIGYNPFFGNQQKTAEPWILSEFPAPFYGEELRLVVAGYIRPEANFTTLQALIDRIHKDAEVSREALTQPSLAKHQSDAWLKPAGAQPNSH